jgi:hypothetical protein
MAAFDIGDQVRLTAAFAVGGTPTAPTTLVLTITAPDGTATTPTPVSESTGVYYHDLTPTQAGWYRYRWVGTGAAVAAERGRLFVRE